jgi:hypothetical protein
MFAPLVVLTVAFMLFVGFNVDNSIILPLFIWLFSGSPLLVSFVLTIVLKSRESTIILLVSTIIYGVWFALLSVGILLDGCGCAFFVFYAIGLFALPGMLLLWIAADIVDRRYQEKALYEAVASSTDRKTW